MNEGGRRRVEKRSASEHEVRTGKSTKPNRAAGLKPNEAEGQQHMVSAPMPWTFIPLQPPEFDSCILIKKQTQSN